MFREDASRAPTGAVAGAQGEEFTKIIEGEVELPGDEGAATGAVDLFESSAVAHDQGATQGRRSRQDRRRAKRDGAHRRRRRDPDRRARARYVQTRQARAQAEAEAMQRQRDQEDVYTTAQAAQAVRMVQS